MLDIQHLTKTYGGKKAVDDLSLHIAPGEIYGFIGHNGAGKTTTLRMLSGLLQPTGGEADILGFRLTQQPQEIKRRINLSPQETAVAPKLTARENLELIAGIYGSTRKEAKEKAATMLEEFHMQEVAGQRAGTLSGGWQRRLSIAMALISQPQILFLDEPTLGLDVLARRELWNIIEKLKGRVTVILTTHYMEEAADADYVVILDKGQIAAEGTPLQLKNKYTGDFITLYGETEETVKRLNAPYEAIRDAFRISVPNTAAATELIIKYPEIFRDYEITKGKMDDVFLAVTGKRLTGGERK